jgi:arylsulfatase A-like enzyme
LLVISLSLATSCSPEPIEVAPNVVLIVLDTTRADALSSYGAEKLTTPTIDRVASEGIRFEQAIATNYWTLPTHASLLTGQHPSQHRATSETNHLPGQARTLAERLKQAGYATTAFVSNPWLSRERGFAQGFDQFNELWRGRYDDSNSPRLDFDRQATKRSADWLRARSPDAPPFFLFINLNRNHLPFNPESQILHDLFPEPEPGSIEQLTMLKALSGFGTWDHRAGRLELNDSDFRILRQLYLAEVSMTDARIAELMSTLDSLGITDDTLIVITADHGENIGDHGMLDHVFSMFETTLHIPLVMRYPKRFMAGSVDAGIVSQVDIAATILDICGIEVETDVVPGLSLAGPERRARDFVISENDLPLNAIRVMERRYPDFDRSLLNRSVRALRTNRYKLIRYSDGETLLFDLESDPGELKNLAAKEPMLRARMLAQLLGWMRDHAPTTTPENLSSQDAAAMDGLRVLGYVD